MINENAYHASGDLEAHGKGRRVRHLWSPISSGRTSDHAPRQAGGSRRAAEILADWRCVPKFRKVMPVDPPRAEGNEGQRDAEPKIAIGA